MEIGSLPFALLGTAFIASVIAVGVYAVRAAELAEEARWAQDRCDRAFARLNKVNRSLHQAHRHLQDAKMNSASDHLIAKEAEQLFELWWSSPRSVGQGRNIVPISVIEKIERLGSVIIDERGDGYFVYLAGSAKIDGVKCLTMKIDRQKLMLDHERLASQGEMRTAAGTGYVSEPKEAYDFFDRAYLRKSPGIAGQLEYKAKQEAESLRDRNLRAISIQSDELRKSIEVI